MKKILIVAMLCMALVATMAPAAAAADTNYAQCMAAIQEQKTIQAQAHKTATTLRKKGYKDSSAYVQAAKSTWNEAQAAIQGYQKLANYTDEDIRILTTTVFHEAGHTTEQLRQYVAQVVLNRVKDSRFPSTVKAVINQPGQYATKSVGVLIKTFGAACEYHFDKERYEFCWIVDFPMYEIGEESGLLEFCHNPFSMPSGGLEVLLKAERGEIDPLSITADQYDLVCNGVELSSGAVRNHDPEIMIKAFEMVRLGEEDVKAKFPAMYNAFTYGAPPHAGIAPGVDRMVMLLAGEDSIREIIPFPMNKNAQDVMMSAPSEVTQKQLDELHIAIVKPQD